MKITLHKYPVIMMILSLASLAAFTYCINKSIVFIQQKSSWLALSLTGVTFFSCCYVYFGILANSYTKKDP